MSNEQNNPPSDVVRTLEDRRRPDRVKVVSPDLLPLLRSDGTSVAEGSVGIPVGAPAADDARKGYGDPIRGISIALAVAIPAWILIVLGVLIFVVPRFR